MLGTTYLAHLALLALCAGHVAISLSISPSWIFAKYPNIAASLRRGDLTPQQAGDASPGYLLVNLLLDPETLRWLQAFVAAAAIACVFAVVKRARGATFAWVAALALALAQPWLVYSAVLEPDLAIGALQLAALACLALGSPERLRASAMAGAALGAAFALRPTAALFGVVGLLWLLVDRRNASRSRLVRAHALAYAAAFVVTAGLPASILFAEAGQDVRATMSGGQVFHQGHRPEDSGVRVHYPVLMKLVEAHLATQPDHKPDYAHELYRSFAAAAAGEALPASRAERFWIDKVAAFAWDDTGAFLRQLGRKWTFTVVAPWPGADIAGVQKLAQDERRSVWLSPRLLALAGLAGLLLSLRGGRIERLLALFVVSQQVIYVVFYYTSRYGVTVLPGWCALAGCAAAALWEARRQPRRLALTLAIAAAPVALLALPFVRSESRLEERRLEVPVASEIPNLRAAGRRAEAMERFLDEQASFPDYVWPWSPRGYGLAPDAPETALRAAERARQRYGIERATDSFLLAVLYARAGHCDLALPLADRAAAGGFHGTVEDTDLSLDPDLLASDCLVALGEPQPAFERIVRSLRRWPGTIDGLARAIAATAARPELGDVGDREGWERMLFALHDPASAHFALTRARRLWGDATRALDDADALATLLPEAEPLAELERALCLLDLGRTDDALAAYARSLRIRFYVYGASRFDAAVRAHFAAHPDDHDAAVLALRHWLRQGDDAEVREVLGRHPELAR
jgi:4-amino-4-deoxy-L-arabinose transferase-like glycosyltransferase